MNVNKIEKMSIQYYQGITKTAEPFTITIGLIVTYISYAMVASAVLAPVIESCIKADNINEAINKIQEAYKEYKDSYGFKDEKGADYTKKFEDFYSQLSALKNNVLSQKNAKSNSNEQNVVLFKQFGELADDIMYKSEFILTALNSMKTWAGKVLDHPMFPLLGTHPTATIQIEKNIVNLREHLLLQKGILEDKMAELKAKNPNAEQTQNQQAGNASQISQEEQTQLEQLSNITW